MSSLRRRSSSIGVSNKRFTVPSTRGRSRSEVRLQNNRGSGSHGRSEASHTITSSPTAQHPSSSSTISSSVVEVFSPIGVWYENFEMSLPRIEGQVVINPKLTMEKKKLAQTLFTKYVSSSTQTGSKDSNDEWTRTILRSGTMNDKVSAMTLSIQKNLINSFRMFDSLLATAEKKGRTEAETAIEALKDLFLNNILPNRHLLSFHQRPLSSERVTETHLMAWYFEDQIKVRYIQFVNRLAECLKDTVPYFRSKILRYVFELLNGKPEQEHLLLSLLVNKLGDIENKVASNATHFLTLLLESHPNMKLVVIKEVDTFLNRTNLSKRAQYYAIIFLNQIVLTEYQKEVPEKLVSIYFRMFPRIIDAHKTVDQVDSRLLSALLTGANRAFPFTENNEEYDSQMETLFKIAHTTSFEKSTQALQLIWQIMYSKKNVTDRFYRALYSKLRSSDAFVGSRKSPFLNLLFKSLRYDVCLNRVAGIVKRMLQLCFLQKPNIICALLLIISEVFVAHPKLLNFLNQADQLTDEIRQNSMNVISHYGGDFNKVTKLQVTTKDSVTPTVPHRTETSKNKENNSIHKSDGDVVKHIDTNASHDDNEEEDSLEDLTISTNLDISGLVPVDEGDDDGEGEVEKEKEKEKEKEDNDKKQKHQAQDETTGRAVVKTPGETASHTTITTTTTPDTTTASSMSIQETKPPLSSRLTQQQLKSLPLTQYDPHKREPLYSNVQCTSFWELTLLCMHVHPSVKKWAEMLLNGQQIVYTGNPIEDLDFLNFLDRFSYKKPKKTNEKKLTGSIMQPSYVSYAKRAAPVNDDSFIQQPETEIREDEIFFYKYFKRKAETKTKKEEKKTEEEEDIFSVDSEEADAIIGEAEEDEDKQVDVSKSDFWSKEGEEEEEYSYDKLDDEDFDDDADEDLKALVEDEDEDEDENDEDEEFEGQKHKKENVFADVEEFAQLLEESGDTENKKNKRRTQKSINKPTTHFKRKPIKSLRNKPKRSRLGNK